MPAGRDLAGWAYSGHLRRGLRPAKRPFTLTRGWTGHRSVTLRAVTTPSIVSAASRTATGRESVVFRLPETPRPGAFRQFEAFRVVAVRLPGGPVEQAAKNSHKILSSKGHLAATRGTAPRTRITYPITRRQRVRITHNFVTWPVARPCGATRRAVFRGGTRIRTGDLRVMSPMRYCCAIPLWRAILHRDRQAGPRPRASGLCATPVPSARLASLAGESNPVAPRGLEPRHAVTWGPACQRLPASHPAQLGVPWNAPRGFVR